MITEENFPRIFCWAWAYQVFSSSLLHVTSCCRAMSHEFASTVVNEPKHEVDTRCHAALSCAFANVIIFNIFYWTSEINKMHPSFAQHSTNGADFKNVRARPTFTKIKFSTMILNDRPFLQLDAHKNWNFSVILCHRNTRYGFFEDEPLESAHFIPICSYSACNTGSK